VALRDARWPVLRQLAGTDRLGRGAAAKSPGSLALLARMATADWVVKSTCPSVAGEAESSSVRRLALLGALGELGGQTLLERRLEPVVARAYLEGRAGRVLRASRALPLAGAAGATLGARNRPVRVASGMALLTASACTRFGVFPAGIASAEDPAATIVPQRARMERRTAG
jgi:hypothetical protein